MYECEDCRHCPLKSRCTKVKVNCKIITIKGYVGCM
ncbi:MAG: hypothetical protein C6W58_06230 [Bacillaceae bacterium]|nr:MAG: hypothetical protein C6W58_06230 [Bacillaceae bacterium]